MSMYTFAQFEEAAKKAGLYDRMNEADIKLAQKNPDAGMSILSGIQEYQKATTPEQRALIHEQVEGVRKNYGGYSGGKDGSAFSILNTPSSFTPNATPDRNYSAVAGNAYNKLTGYGDYQGSKWQGNIDSIGNKIAGYEDYSFNPETSELSKALRKQYAREIGRATEDTMASAAALTGGLPSSYAATAGAQAGDYYASQYVDKLQDVANLEHAIYQANFSKEMNKLAAMQNLEETEYQRYLDQYDRLLSEYNAGLNLDAQNEMVYQNDVSQNNFENQFNYGQLLDQNEWDNAQKEQALTNALTAAQYGDYTKLNALGYNTSAYEQNAKDAAALDRAMAAAQYGDYSQLNALGIDTSSVKSQADLDYAIALAEIGDYSALKRLGVDTTRLEAADQQSAATGNGGGGDLPSWSAAFDAWENYEDNSLLTLLYASIGQPLPDKYKTVNGGNNGGTEGNEDEPTGGNAEFDITYLDKQIGALKNGGAKDATLEQMIEEALDGGDITKAQANTLRKKYNINIFARMFNN